MLPFYALIVPQTGPPPTGPTGIWGGSNEPFPGYGLPPFGPGRPPGMWGGSNEPFPGYGLPPFQPGMPVKPPGMWGGSNEPFPGWGLPKPQPPLLIWGPNDPRPGWGLPEPQPPLPDPPPLPNVVWKTGWSEATGWIIVGVPQGPHPTPSA